MEKPGRFSSNLRAFISTNSPGWQENPGGFLLIIETLRVKAKQRRLII